MSPKRLVLLGGRLVRHLRRRGGGEVLGAKGVGKMKTMGQRVQEVVGGVAPIPSDDLIDRGPLSETDLKAARCFLGYVGKCANPDCPHTINETDKCERCGAEFLFAGE